MIKLNFIEKLAYNFLKGEHMAVLPEMALEALKDGIETPSLLILAGLGKNEEYFVIHQHYKQMLYELGLTFEKRETKLFLIKALINKVINEGLNIFDACCFLFNETMNSWPDGMISDKSIAEGGLKEVYKQYIIMDYLMDNSFSVSSRNKEDNEDLEAIKQYILARFQEFSDLNV